MDRFDMKIVTISNKKMPLAAQNNYIANPIVLLAIFIFLTGFSAIANSQDRSEPLLRSSIRISIDLDSESNSNNPPGLLDSEPSPPEVTVLDRSLTNLPSRRLRKIAYTPSMIVIVGLDAKREEVFRDARQDPRYIRAEIPDEIGGWIRRDVYLQKAQFTFSVPNIDNLNSIWLYKPIWNGTQFEFQLLANVAPR